MAEAQQTARMTLRTTLTSPYGRKVRMAAAVLGLDDVIDVVPANTLDAADTLRLQNPLGKMPCLLLADGMPVYDSRVILEFLDGVSLRPQLFPEAWIPRYRALTRAALFDGITDAALLMVYERRFRSAGQVSQVWLDHQAGKVMRGLETARRDLPGPETTDVASIGLACALGYLDWRKPVEWRGPFPELAVWLDAFAASEPAFAATAAPTE